MSSGLKPPESFIASFTIGGQNGSDRFRNPDSEPA